MFFERTGASLSSRHQFSELACGFFGCYAVFCGNMRKNAEFYGVEVTFCGRKMTRCGFLRKCGSDSGQDRFGFGTSREAPATDDLAVLP